jgi:hypothetical protein
MVPINGSGAAAVGTAEPREICEPARPLISNTAPPIQIQRLRLLAGRLHTLGPRPLFEYLNEVIVGLTSPTGRDFFDFRGV